MAKKTKNAHDIFLRYVEKIASTGTLGILYTKFFEKMTLEEFSMVEIKPENSILHIGCGGIPNTLLILARHLEAQYVGIDKDLAAVKRARTLVDRYDLSHSVTIDLGDAVDYPLDSFDIIIISLGVEPRKRVFSRIKNEAPDSASIIARKPWDFMDKIYGKESFIPEDFVVKDTFNRQDFIKSILLKKTKPH